MWSSQLLALFLPDKTSNLCRFDTWKLLQNECRNAIKNVSALLPLQLSTSQSFEQKTHSIEDVEICISLEFTVFAGSPG